MQGFIYFQDVHTSFWKKYTFVSTSFKKFQHGEHIWKELIQLMTIDLETEPSAALLVVLIRMLTNQIFWGPVLRYDQQQRSHHHSLAPTTSHQERKRVRLFCVCVCGWPDQKIYRLLILYLHKKSWGKWVKKEGSSRLSYSPLPNNWRETVSKRRHTTYWKDTNFRLIKLFDLIWLLNFQDKKKSLVCIFTFCPYVWHLSRKPSPPKSKGKRK